MCGGWWTTWRSFFSPATWVSDRTARQARHQSLPTEPACQLPFSLPTLFGGTLCFAAVWKDTCYPAPSTMTPPPSRRPDAHWADSTWKCSWGPNSTSQGHGSRCPVQNNPEHSDGSRKPWLCNEILLQWTELNHELIRHSGKENPENRPQVQETPDA